MNLIIRQDAMRGLWCLPYDGNIMEDARRAAWGAACVLVEASRRSVLRRAPYFRFRTIRNAALRGED